MRLTLSHAVPALLCLAGQRRPQRDGHLPAGHKRAAHAVD